MLQHVSCQASTEKNLNHFIKKKEQVGFVFLRDQMERDMLFISNMKRKPLEWKGNEE